MSWKAKYQNLCEKLHQVNWYLVFGITFLGVVIAGIVAVSFQLKHMVNDANELPIEAVVIQGELRYTNAHEIQVALRSLLSSSFFNADVERVQERLEALPWVYRASVKREWPAKLKVLIKEQDAAAHWNTKDWLNQYGDVFKAPLVEAQTDKLPQLFGPDDSAKEVLQGYKQMNALLTINGFEMRELSLTPRHAWHIQLDDGIELNLGREDKMSRVQRFIDVYPEILKQGKPIKNVDLRYDTGLAVGWADRKVRVDNE
ncbi:cell division protein FtsQ/DivIB [Shewanella sp. 202IG2-18]|nr:cell division protein FtsQ/DivIB [Parashewanella hymeniacidonis]